MNKIIITAETVIVFVLLFFTGGFIPGLILTVLSIHLIYELAVKKRKDDKEEENKF